jgi:hypothetical protein
MSNHPISASNWSFECQLDTDCGATGHWVATTSQPGTARLWDSGTNWALLEKASGTYDWNDLDTWLDLLATHQPRAAIYTFGHVPCWVSSSSCTGVGYGSGKNWSPGPPTDLTSSGSPTFNAFVTALTKHCSPAGNCVEDYIKYWELWNEANLPQYWTGTQSQLYNMFKAAVPIIRRNVPGAIVSTPPVCGGDTAWMSTWLSLENANGRLSDYYGFHVYLQSYTPEIRIKMVERMLAVKNNAGWTTTPWMDTETNYLNTTDTCSTLYTLEDCRGQLVRWHAMLYAYQGGSGGALIVGWYNWAELNVADYDTYYYTMMQWFTGATFSASCAADGDAWSCPLTEANGNSALVVWNPTGNSQYTPATRYVDYKAFNGTFGGTTRKISPEQSTTIGVIPIMFESK